jgi:glutamine synthetase type III
LAARKVCCGFHDVVVALDALSLTEPNHVLNAELAHILVAIGDRLPHTRIDVCVLLHEVDCVLTAIQLGDDVKGHSHNLPL